MLEKLSWFFLSLAQLRYFPAQLRKFLKETPELSQSCKFAELSELREKSLPAQLSSAQLFFSKFATLSWAELSESLRVIIKNLSGSAYLSYLSLGEMRQILNLPLSQGPWLFFCIKNILEKFDETLALFEQMLPGFFAGAPAAYRSQC